VSRREGTLNFAELSGVRPMIETYPLEKAAEAYARMMSGKAQFRVVCWFGADLHGSKDLRYQRKTNR
jgi:D-arabinose 1-dehydrogenase-like Zn-dependent alcohol dehydrogenase